MIGNFRLPIHFATEVSLTELVRRDGQAFCRERLLGHLLVGLGACLRLPGRTPRHRDGPLQPVGPDRSRGRNQISNLHFTMAADFIDDS